MKTYNILLIVFLTIFSLNIHAQIKVKTNGKAIIGQDRSDDDSDNTLSASVFGKFGECRYGSKLAFGDFGSYSSSSYNAFIGEYGSYDSDELWLSGKNGIRWTSGGKANQLICRSYYSSGYKFKFYVPAYNKYGYLIGSDASFKKNVKKIDSCLVKLKQLNGISYNLIENLSTDKGTAFPDSLQLKDN